MVKSLGILQPLQFSEDKIKFVVNASNFILNVLNSCLYFLFHLCKFFINSVSGKISLFLDNNLFSCSDYILPKFIRSKAGTVVKSLIGTDGGSLFREDSVEKQNL